MCDDADRGRRPSITSGVDELTRRSEAVLWMTLDTADDDPVRLLWTHVAMPVERPGDSVGLLVERTEGWPAGVYLAALWLRDLKDPDRGVRAFAGSARHVADDLTEEVLRALTPETREFLVHTSTLGRFTPELCDAVHEREDSAAMIAELARSNMFLVALDTGGAWYRYHHLFGELLFLGLASEDAAELRRRAAGWCQAHGLVEDAIAYAAAAGDASNPRRATWLFKRLPQHTFQLAATHRIDTSANPS